MLASSWLLTTFDLWLIGCTDSRGCGYVLHTAWQESTRMVLARKTRSPGAKSTWKAVLAMNANLLSAFYITVVVFNVVILIPTEDLVAQLY